jgi:hypothetical protein
VTPQATADSAPQHRILIIAGWAALAVMLVLGVIEAAKGKAGDFQCFYDAAKAARLGQDLYGAGTGGYIYPPLLAWALQPLSLLPPKAAAIVWVVAMALLIPLAAVLASDEFADRLGLSGSPLVCRAAAGFGILLVFDKLLRELKEGNCNLLIIVALVLALRWLPRRPWLAGLAIGLAINLLSLCPSARTHLLLEHRADVPRHRLRRPLAHGRAARHDASSGQDQSALMGPIRVDPQRPGPLAGSNRC